VQPNTAYPATAYLQGYLADRGLRARQMDLSIELLTAVFSSDFLTEAFAGFTGSDDPAIERTYRLRKSYIGTVDAVLRFLQGHDPTLANLICSADFLPQGSRFEAIEDLDAAYGNMGLVDCAKYLATLYLEDIADFLRVAVSPHFGLARYAEQIALSLPDFAPLQAELSRPANLIEQRMLALLATEIEYVQPRFIGFSVPFPGNLLAALRCAQFIKERYPAIKIILGGGYPSTELRALTDPAIFDFVDYITLDDGELPLEQLIRGEEPVRTFQRIEKKVVYSGGEDRHTPFREAGCPDFIGLPLANYFSLVDSSNPMQRLWGDGRWNKMALAHGCYWAKCAFCDTSLDYICRFEALDAVTAVDYMERIMTQTGQSGFHFVDEAAPPKLLKEMALEILRRGLRVSWWGNIRFEAAFTADVCLLLAASGCIAVSGGVETASDRLLEKMNKGVTIEQLTLVLRNFYYAGILTHTYLIYGFPTQTLQETVDALEVVRLLFQADLIGSAFWHRYAMTIHSPSGANPEAFGVRVKKKNLHPFANNEIHFAEDRLYNVAAAGEALRRATASYMRGQGLQNPVHQWFEGKAPQATHEATLVTDRLIQPDGSRIYDDRARLIWIGHPPHRTAEGLEWIGNAKEKALKFKDFEVDFLLELLPLAADLSRTLRFSEVKSLYAQHTDEAFVVFYHSKKWDILRSFGLLQI
jgi:radical SAM superfamily enzyme YgiQ (UPF0313 family)